MIKQIWNIAALFFLMSLSVHANSIPDKIANVLHQSPPKQITQIREMGSLFSILVQVYDARLYRPIWIDDSAKLTANGKRLLSRLNEAQSDGLNPEHYLLDKLNTLAKETPSSDPIVLELLLTLSTMQFTEDLRNGRLTPGDLQMGLPILDNPVDHQAFFAAAANGEDPVKLIDAYAPQIHIYQAMRRLMHEWQGILHEGELTALQLSKTLNPEDPLPANFAAGILDRLALYRLPAPQSSDIYSTAWVDAIKALQKVHGLTIDGVVGKQTLTALNMSWDARIGKMIASMERLRWLPAHIPQQRFIIVNVPEFKLRAFNGALSDPELKMPVVVGKSYSRYRTPIFREVMKYVVFTPYWNIPNSILHRSIVPAIDGPEYFSKHYYEMIEHFSWTAKVHPPTPENIEKLKNGKLLLRQTPGAHNALGEAKFIFPNANHIYLHGTPAHSLFQQSVRAFSHGCIRVENVPKLATWIFQEQGWDRNKVDEVIASKQPKQVNLENEVLVAILYQTAVIDSSGDIFLFDDIYGHDEHMLRRLQQL
ncbi:L,D-transpeptidase family protein [Corallincola spongiicola]|uniref:L,D-TPase catalytic domain-containing protein n=1 Tax=Corallincola spongiicola TaxID=2520508 RepID=A0ABY1WST4_9GAMM|nr:L,D-transpeptidase family protein [Corallincola spongiicola]TAA47801.1 hypothetical protein EXY25_00695 [Corallincola spongiicola]